MGIALEKVTREHLSGELNFEQDLGDKKEPAMWQSGCRTFQTEVERVKGQILQDFEGQGEDFGFDSNDGR